MENVVKRTKESEPSIAELEAKVAFLEKLAKVSIGTVLVLAVAALVLDIVKLLGFLS